MAELFEVGKENVADFIAQTGVYCTVQGLTYNTPKKLWEPPYVTKAVNVPFTIGSIATIQDPDISTLAQTLNISLSKYRLMTCPAGMVTIEKNDRIIAEPVISTSARYQVIEALAPDETTPLDVTLHCQKV